VTRSAIVLWAKVALTELVMVGGMSCGGGLVDAWRGSRVHNPPEAEDLVPVRMTMPRSVIATVVLVKMAEHPKSQTWPMERSELE
jgi:hypothetical protein